MVVINFSEEMSKYTIFLPLNGAFNNVAGPRRKRGKSQERATL